MVFRFARKLSGFIPMHDIAVPDRRPDDAPSAPTLPAHAQIAAGGTVAGQRRRLMAVALLPLLGGCASVIAPLASPAASSPASSDRSAGGQAAASDPRTASSAAGAVDRSATGSATTTGSAAVPSPDPAAEAQSAAPLSEEALQADFLLLGEVHDNGVQHRLRLRWLQWLSDSRRIALAFEQLDADRQNDLDRALQASMGAEPGLRARHVAEAAGFNFDGWHWPFYAPYFELALRRGLPLAAANLSRSEAMRIARGQAAAVPEPASWREAERRAMAQAINAGHCGLLPPASIAPMANAQIARDRCLAQAIVAAQRRHGLPVVLLAGNGHVRRDIGVPGHLLELAPQARVMSVGLIESGETDIAAYDRIAVTAAAARPDPCEALRRRMVPASR